MGEFKVGDRVRKVGGDARFEGVVVAAFRKLGGLVRYVVEDARGLLMIYSAANLEMERGPDVIDAVRVRYVNHRGEESVRRVLPTRLWWGSTAWHPEPQWLLDVWDFDRRGGRTYAMAGIKEWVPGSAGPAGNAPAGPGQG